MKIINIIMKNTSLLICQADSWSICRCAWTSDVSIGCDLSDISAFRIASDALNEGRDGGHEPAQALSNQVWVEVSLPKYIQIESILCLWMKGKPVFYLRDQFEHIDIRKKTIKKQQKCCAQFN